MKIRCSTPDEITNLSQFAVLKGINLSCKRTDKGLSEFFEFVYPQPGLCDKLDDIHISTLKALGASFYFDLPPFPFASRVLTEQEWTTCSYIYGYSINSLGEWSPMGFHSVGQFKSKPWSLRVAIELPKDDLNLWYFVTDDLKKQLSDNPKKIDNYDAWGYYNINRNDWIIRHKGVPAAYDDDEPWVDPSIFINDNFVYAVRADAKKLGVSSARNLSDEEENLLRAFGAEDELISLEVLDEDLLEEDPQLLKELSMEVRQQLEKEIQEDKKELFDNLSEWANPPIDSRPLSEKEWERYSYVLGYTYNRWVDQWEKSIVYLDDYKDRKDQLRKKIYLPDGYEDHLSEWVFATKNVWDQFKLNPDSFDACAVYHIWDGSRKEKFNDLSSCDTDNWNIYTKENSCRLWDDLFPDSDFLYAFRAVNLHCDLSCADCGEAGIPEEYPQVEEYPDCDCGEDQRRWLSVQNALAQALETPEGRAALAQSFIHPTWKKGVKPQESPTSIPKSAPVPKALAKQLIKALKRFVETHRNCGSDGDINFDVAEVGGLSVYEEACWALEVAESYVRCYE